MKAAFETRVQAIKWSNYSNPCWPDHQSLISGLLIQIRRGDNDVALEAAQRLWDIAAHQGNVGSSAVPTAGFLIEMLEELPPRIQDECLDTLFQFSNYLTIPDELWCAELRKVFWAALPVFKRLAASPDDDVSCFSEMIIENIEASAPLKTEPGGPPNGGPPKQQDNSATDGVPPAVS